ncbi:MAG: hypothetical protein ACRDFR_08970 [Candidatus Limnocylindria bacterium]
MHRVRLLIGLALVASACATPAQPAASVLPSPTPGPAAGNLPPGCNPIDLRAPSGERIELDGTWTEVGTAGDLMTWWIRTQGDCVWGAGSIEDVGWEGTFEGRPDQVQSLAGVLGSDFVITGEIVWLGALPIGAPGHPAPYSPLRMFVEFDDAGGILLREDRQPGASGPRCPDPQGFCPAPLVLQRVN